jgi:hypothetical protein
MKARILSDRSAAALESRLDALAGEASITIRHVGYSIDPEGRHHALVLFTPGADRREDVSPAASRFIADALETGTPPQEKR